MTEEEKKEALEKRKARNKALAEKRSASNLKAIEALKAQADEKRKLLESANPTALQFLEGPKQ